MRAIAFAAFVAVIALAASTADVAHSATNKALAGFHGGCFRSHEGYTFQLAPSGGALYYEGGGLVWKKGGNWSANGPDLVITRSMADPDYPGATFYFTIVPAGIVKNSSRGLFAHC